MLDTKHASLKSGMHARAALSKTYGMTVASDAATVMGEPLVNIIGAVPVQSKPLALGLQNVSRHLSDGRHKDGLFYAEQIVKSID
mmetsp:Transcript_26100/g.89722  ORF Transcript_26100/g.89722 Transcript_26100/m.89722 type:complete len:85 (-) Transcript_26100:1534-1788(-)